MPSSLLQFPHYLDEQFVWLSIAAWVALLAWLWPRASRRRMLLWIALACALHLTPITGQLLRATSALTMAENRIPLAVWLLQAVNIAVFGMIVGIWCLSRRRIARYRQLQAVLAERRRIASDLHDGVGSRLTALLASQAPRPAGPSELSMALRACLLELQMTVDSLDDEATVTLVERLAHLRYRVQPAFDGLRIELVWNVHDVPQAHALPSDHAMQICRIAQEALSNALRHSQASRVEVRFGPLDRSGGLLLEVQDNGRGLEASSPMPLEQLGKGLRSMRARADALNGELAIMDAAPRGLCIRLVLSSDALALAAREPEPESSL